METRNSSVSSVVRSQSVPSRILVVLVEETEVRGGGGGAERLASIPLDKAVRLLAGEVCPAVVIVCEDCIMMPGAVGTLSPSDSASVGPVGPVGTLSPSDSVSVGQDDPDGMLSDFVGMLFPAVPAGIPFPVCPVGPVGPDGTLSSSVIAGILIPAVPTGLPFQSDPVGTLSPSDFESAGPVGPVGTLSPFDHVEGLSPIVPVGELSSVDPARRLLGGWFQRSGQNFRTGGTPLLRRQVPAEVPVGENIDVVDMDITVDICQVVPDVIDSRAVVAMVGLDTVCMGWRL